MPAGLPGDTATLNGTGNPNAGRPVIFDLMSGPKGSPLDKDSAGNASTGALSTGIGFGLSPQIDPISNALGSNAVLGIRAAGFSDDYTPGVTKPDGTAATTSILMYIGGGRNTVTPPNGNGVSAPAPFTAGFGIGAAGNGGSRDAGAGPAFTGFALKTVTAVGAVAVGAVVETGFVNRSPSALVANQSVFGSSTTATAAVA